MGAAGFIIAAIIAAVAGGVGTAVNVSETRKAQKEARAMYDDELATTAENTAFNKNLSLQNLKLKRMQTAQNKEQLGLNREQMGLNKRAQDESEYKTRYSVTKDVLDGFQRMVNDNVTLRENLLKRWGA